MPALISITTAATETTLRRYETGGAHPLKTHEGIYDPAGITPYSVELYRVAGVKQDRVGARDAATGRVLRLCGA